jgi:putative ABC transport system ATP-binding protein
MFFMDASENIDINEAFQKVQAEMKQVFPQISMSATQLVNHAHKTKTMSFTEMVILALSGFIIVRVAIAKLLLKDCDLILGDEPTASLDEENRDLILGLFRKMADNGKTVLLVSHDVNVQSFADYRMMI